MTTAPSLTVSRPPERFYRPELDWLRFCAFLGVFVHHALPKETAYYTVRGFPETLSQWIVSALEAGAFGVDLFFVLSSYLITELLLREQKSCGRIDVKAFYIRRILRIWPLYYSYLLLVALAVPLALPNDHLPLAHLLGFALLAGNWVCAFQGYPDSVAAPLWSVSIEEQFYICWPLLLARVGVRHLRKLAWALVGLAFVTRAVLAWRGTEHPGVWCNTLARLDPIAFGALLSVALHGRVLTLSRASRAALVGAGTLVMVLAAHGRAYDGWLALFSYPLVSGAAVLLLIAFLGLKGGQTRPGRALAYLGKISYGLYVFHTLALGLVGLLHPPTSVYAVGSLLLCVGMAALSFQVLEGPALRLKARFARVPSRDNGPPFPR